MYIIFYLIFYSFTNFINLIFIRPFYKTNNLNNNIKKNINNITHISFSGAGCYYVGVIKALQELDPNLYKNVKISATSVGLIHGLNYLLNIDSEILLNEYYNKYDYQNKKILFNKLFLGDYIEYYHNTYYNNINKNIFNNIKFGTSIIENNKLTPLYFNLNTNILDSIYKTCHIPYFTYKSYLYKNKYLDGDITSPKPHFFNIDEKNTLYIGSNKKHNYDISFNKKYYHFFEPYYPLNKFRINHLHNLGYRDTINYFKYLF